jgi:hypothetical protein
MIHFIINHTPINFFVVHYWWGIVLIVWLLVAVIMLVNMKIVSRSYPQPCNEYHHAFLRKIKVKRCELCGEKL